MTFFFLLFDDDEDKLSSFVKISAVVHVEESLIAFGVERSAVVEVIASYFSNISSVVVDLHSDVDVVEDIG